MKTKPQIRLTGALKKAAKIKKKFEKLVKRATPFGLREWIEEKNVEARDIKASVKRIERNAALRKVFLRAHRAGISIFLGRRPEIDSWGRILVRWENASDEEVIDYLEKLKD